MDNLLNTAEEPQVLIDPKSGLYYITQPEEGAEYVSMAEYIRRRHKADKEKDPLADVLYHTSIRNVMKRGDIVMLKQGIHFFIDWNKYKFYVFQRYKQMPKRK